MQSQSKALASINQEQLALYYGIGRYISYNTRKGAWGKDAIATISKQLSIEMPGLKGFSPSNLKNMRLFYEQWRCFDTISPVATGEIQKSVNSPDASGELDSEINSAKSKLSDIPIAAFFSIGFTHHIAILSGSSTMEERSFYIHLCHEEKLSVSELQKRIAEDAFHNLHILDDDERIEGENPPVLPKTTPLRQWIIGQYLDILLFMNYLCFHNH